MGRLLSFICAECFNIVCKNETSYSRAILSAGQHISYCQFEVLRLEFGNKVYPRTEPNTLIAFKNKYNFSILIQMKYKKCGKIKDVNKLLGWFWPESPVFVGHRTFNKQRILEGFRTFYEKKKRSPLFNS